MEILDRDEIPTIYIIFMFYALSKIIHHYIKETKDNDIYIEKNKQIYTNFEKYYRKRG